MVALLQQMGARVLELAPLAGELLLEVEESQADTELLAAEIASQVSTCSGHG